MKYIIFLLVLVIPFASSLNLTETTLNDSIYVNGSVELEKLIVNETHIALFNLSSGGNFTNIADSNINLSFFDLTNPYYDIYWDNETLIEENATNRTITIPTSRRIYISGEGVDNAPPEITIINPTTNEDEKIMPVEYIIKTSELSNCMINIDNSSNISMSTNDNINFKYSENTPNGLHEAIFYCTDYFDNQANKSIEFYVYRTSTGSDSSGGVVITPSTEIKLENISINYDTWYKNEENSLYIYSYNSTGGLTDLTNISINSIPEVKKEITRLGEGVYRAIFDVGNSSNMTINVIAQDNDKILEEEINIIIEERPLIEEVKKETKSKIEKFFNLFKDKLFLTIVFFLSLILIISFLVVLIKRKNKKV